MRRSSYRRRRALALLALVVAAAAVVLALSNGGSPRRARPVARRAPAPAPAPVAPRPVVRHRHVPAPGSLPQTDAYPSASSPRFRAAMAALWQGVVTGASRQALVAFFPEQAYAQVKAIGSPRYDWSERLVSNFRLDVQAAHAYLGADAHRARLTAVNVPPGHWIPPGACYNAVGYYEAPNARLVYREGSATRSFGIASLISWRGEWYVIHLGAVDSAGVVDDPEPGPGTSVQSGTC